ncbi:MAG TPA: energy transducer TonB, partial [Longimicrobium sp.]|nr:energy transducer TonB [Longimicrobium sp.]
MMKTIRFFPFVVAVVATLTAAGGAHGQRTPVPTPSPADAAPPTDERTYELAEVEELPRPTNSADFARTLMASYPPALNEARVEGRVEARFRILEDGSVDSASISIISTDNEQFNGPTIRALPVLRFRPAKVGGRPVKVWVILPVSWLPQPFESPGSQAMPSAPAAPSGQSGETYELVQVE